MSDDQQLLDEARHFCDATTGEVIERIPDVLMKKLRAAKLARGIPAKPSRRTESHATWFVFLTGEIRDRVLVEWRTANRARKRKRTQRKAAAGSSAIDTEAETRRPTGRD